MRLVGLAVIGMVLAFGGMANAAPPIEVYGHLPHIEQMSISPNGQRIAFVDVSGDERQVFVRQIGGSVLAKWPIGQAKVRGVSWAGDDHLLILSTETASASGAEDEKGEYPTLVVGNLKAGTLTAPLTDTKFFPGVQGIHGARNVGGRWYLYAGLQLLPNGSKATADVTYRGPDLYRIDLDTSEISLVARTNRYGRQWTLDSMGQIVATEEYVSETGESRVYAGVDRLIAHVKSDSGGVGVDGLGRTPGSILVEGLNGEGKNPQEVNLQTGAVADFLPNDDREVELLRARDTQLVIGYATGGAHPRVVMFEPALQTAVQRAVKPFSDARVALLSASNDYSRIIIHTEGDTDSGTYYLVDLTARKAEPLGYDYPPVGSKDVGARRFVEYSAADGTRLEGILTLPPGLEAKNLPVVVLPHGGPRAHDVISFDWWSEAFASRGYAVFQPNYRGSTGYGQALLKAGYREWGKKMQTDITDGLAKLAADGTVDPKRACIVGASYGGYAALAGVTVQQGFYRCAVSVAGVSDLNAMLNWVMSRAGYEDNSASRYWNVAMGAHSADDPAMQPISPYRLAAKADAPILLVYGRDDTVVPTDQSVRMARALRAAGKAVETVVMDHEDHWLSREASRTQMLKSAIAFVEKNNPPDAKGYATVEPKEGKGQ
jgi:dipeptidyl aminopeptidase/acylaminoacyl peptidase